MARIGHDPLAIAHTKCSVWAKNKKCQKGAKNDSTTTLKLLCQKTNSKTPNILKMTAV